MAVADNTAGSVSSVAKQCGLDVSQLAEFYRLFARTERVVTLFSLGVNQSSAGTDKVNSIINCHLLTGRIGQPGAGPFSITGQPNAMGGREVGGLANMLAAARLIAGAALLRQESRGGHFRLDFPAANPALAQRSKGSRHQR